MRAWGIGVALVVAMGLAACGGDDGPSAVNETDGEAELTLRQEQALQLAQGYIDSGGWSRAALIDQVSSAGEGFSKADARLAADNVDAIWKEEALQVAQSRIDGDFDYSRVSLIGHLTKADGFTLDQAQYAVDKVY